MSDTAYLRTQIISLFQKELGLKVQDVDDTWILVDNRYQICKTNSQWNDRRTGKKGRGYEYLHDLIKSGRIDE